MNSTCCFCKKDNHTSLKCKYKRKCKYCSRENHLSSQCNKRIRQDYKGCIYCKTTTHETDDCTNENSINRQGCGHCLGTDHFTKNCPLRNNPKVSKIASARFDENSCNAEDFFRANEYQCKSDYF